jgi:hypothetical protein
MRAAGLDQGAGRVGMAARYKELRRQRQATAAGIF